MPEVWRVVDKKVIHPPPRFLQPKSFHFSTTSGTDGFVKGTLNFCIETHREPPRNVDPKLDPFAGIWADNETFFRASKCQTGDGVLAFSRDLFMDRYISRTLAPNLYLDIKTMLGHYLKYWDDKPAAYTGLPKGYIKYTDETSFPTPTSFRRTVAFGTCGAPQEGTMAWYGADFIEGELDSALDSRMSCSIPEYLLTASQEAQRSMSM